MVTVQAALDRLTRDGFIASRQRAGTFVLDHPPHLFDHGLVFTDDLGEPRNWGQFWRAILNESLDPVPWRPRRLRAYRGVNNRADNEVYQQLIGDVRAHRLAGLILPSMPGELCGTSLLDDGPAIPMVAVMDRLRDFPSVHALQLDHQGMIDLAMEKFVAAGRKRLGMFVYLERTEIERIITAAAQRGLEVRPYWAQRVSVFQPTYAREVAHLMMHAGQNERPDAIFVADDNLLEHVSAGIVDAGVSPRDVTIVSHCNFPWPTPSALPVQRVGYDVRTILKVGIDAIDRLRRGEIQPSTSMIPAITESEVEA
jgi:DNA-binding LacI/PurR family transcriptional regulator